MRQHVGRAARITLVAAAAFAALGCEGQLICTLIGCMNGVAVTLASPPPAPYRVEAVTPSGARYSWTCDRSDRCGGRAFFPDFRPNDLRIEILAGSDTARHDFLPPIRYEETYPNGKDCGGPCYVARLTVP